MDDTSTREAPMPDGETRWLDEQEMRIWRSFLQASVRITSQLDDALKQRSGLTIDDYEVLVHLSEEESHRLRMTELSNRLLHSPSRLTQRVDRLAKRGLVSREKCVDDGRGTFACLTDAGRDLIVDLAPHHVADVRRTLIDLIAPNEREPLAIVLERLAREAQENDNT